MADILLSADQKKLLEPGDLVRLLPTWEPSVAAVVTYTGPGAVAEHIVVVKPLESVRGCKADCLASRLTDIRNLGRNFAFPYFVFDQGGKRYVRPKSPIFRNRLTLVETRES